MIPLQHTQFTWSAGLASAKVAITWGDETKFDFVFDARPDVPLSLAVALALFSNLRRVAHEASNSASGAKASKILFSGYDLNMWLRAAHHAILDARKGT